MPALTPKRPRCRWHPSLTCARRTMLVPCFLQDFAACAVCACRERSATICRAPYSHPANRCYDGQSLTQPERLQMNPRASKLTNDGCAKLRVKLRSNFCAKFCTKSNLGRAECGD